MWMTVCLLFDQCCTVHCRLLNIKSRWKSALIKWKSRWKSALIKWKSWWKSAFD